MNSVSVTYKAREMDLLQNVSRKLQINDKKVINKASEHLRLLEVKSSNVKLQEYAKIVICLDIATSHSDDVFDQVVIQSGCCK